MSKPVSKRWRWSDARAAQQWTERRRERVRLLETLAHFPLLTRAQMACVLGLRGVSALSRSLNALQELDIAASIAPVCDGQAQSRYYLTDLGVATLALICQVEPTVLARRCRLRGADLQEMVAGIPYVDRIYGLLVQTMRLLPPGARVVGWRRPWRVRYQRPAGKSEGALSAPAWAAVDGEGVRREFILLPDPGCVPLRAYRPLLHQLHALQSHWGGPLPVLVIGTHRAEAWHQLMGMISRARREASLECWVLTQNRGAEKILPIQVTASLRLVSDEGPFEDRSSWLEGKTGRADGLIPEVVGNLAGDGPRLTTKDRAALDLVGRHPFLSWFSATSVLGWDPWKEGYRRERLLRAGLLRLLSSEESGPVEDYRPEWAQARKAPTREQLLELTADGLKLVAAQHGLTVGAAVRYLGLCGGGPEKPIGKRRSLAGRYLCHTRGADELIVQLELTLRFWGWPNRASGLLEWRNATSCSRGPMRPDAYVAVRLEGRAHGFFLEYDRATVGFDEYLRKFGAYYDYWLNGRYEDDYDSLPLILVVTPYGKEERIARAAMAAALGRPARLPMLLTEEWRIREWGNRDGMLGRIWREPNGVGDRISLVEFLCRNRSEVREA